MNETVNPHGNPQGQRACHGASADGCCSARGNSSKIADEALLDYWCSSLVLSAAFKFRVAPITRITCIAEGEWQLSLISPEEWGRRLPGDYVAECQLSQDMTWKLRLILISASRLEMRWSCSSKDSRSRPPGRKALTSYCLTMWKVFRISSAYWPLR